MKSLFRFIMSEARAIVLVILVAIVLPSVLLSIFAIWAIGTERAHVQDRIRRDARALTDKVVEETLATLSRARTEMTNRVAKLNSVDDGAQVLAALRASYPCFSCFLLVDEEGAIVYPPVPRTETMLILGRAPAGVHDALRKPHNLEFVQVDLGEAESAYREVLDNASDPVLKASALLGLARVSAKRDRWAESVELFERALSEYGAHRDETGLLVGPAAALRIAEIMLDLDKPGEFAQALMQVHNQVQKRRAQLSREEADFLDARLVSLVDRFGRENTASAQQVAALGRVPDEITVRRRHEALAYAIALKLGEGRFFIEDGVTGFEHAGESFAIVGAPVTAANRQLVACALAPVRQVERDLVGAQVEKQAGSDEVGLAVTDAQRGVVAGKAPPPKSFHLAESRFPEPLSNLRARAYLKGYESLTALSNIRTKLYVWAVALAITGIVVGAVVTYISVRRTMRAAELKSDFVSNVTHELKTPLTSIRMFAETLHDGRVKDEKDAKECLETIVAESERLSRLIDKVLDFRAIEKGRRKFDFRVADIREVILGALQTFRRQMRGYEATVYVNIPRELPQLRMDPDAIGEVLLNLLTNAYKYSRPEDRRIWVGAEVTKGTVRVSVEDRGIGIPKREHKAIFDKFYRVDDLLSREVDGTGLGLTISRHVAEAHGGTVEVESREGKGSKFTLVLKLQD